MGELRFGPALIALLGLAACTGGGQREVLISAAASLTDVMQDMEAVYEQQNPDVDLVLNLGASSSLREQILAGAPVDLYLSADTLNMNELAAEGVLAGPPVHFATNALIIVVPKGNPAQVSGLRDMADPALFIGLCAPSVPCGRYAGEVLSRADIVPEADTLEANSRALVAKVGAGDLDAGLVYATDFFANSDKVDSLSFPDALNVTATYSIALLVNAPNQDDASDFLDFFLSPDGSSIIRDRGFESP